MHALGDWCKAAQKRASEWPEARIEAAFNSSGRAEGPQGLSPAAPWSSSLYRQLFQGTVGRPVYPLMTTEVSLFDH
jgi:hypothetical protein